MPTSDGNASTTPSGSSSGSVASCQTDLGAPDAVIVAADACPEGTTEKSIVHSNPTAGAGACACGDCTATSDLCAGASFTWHWSSDNLCTANMKSYNVPNDGACVPVTAGVNTKLDVYNMWSRTPIAGTCTAAKAPALEKVTTKTFHQCAPNPGGTFCRGSDARVCVPGDSSGTCPTAFPVALVVGDGPKLDCGECTCERKATACHIEYHNDASCTTKQYERDADGQCLKTGQPVTYTIKMFPTGATCTTVAGAATASLTDSRTLCCTQ